MLCPFYEERFSFPLILQPLSCFERVCFPAVRHYQLGGGKRWNYAGMLRRHLRVRSNSKSLHRQGDTHWRCVWMLRGWEHFLGHLGLWSKIRARPGFEISAEQSPGILSPEAARSHPSRAASPRLGGSRLTHLFAGLRILRLTMANG